MVTGEVRSWQGSGEGRRNEDWALIDRDGCCAMLADGATGLTKVRIADSTSDAAWYARALVRESMHEIRQGNLPISAAMHDAANRVAREYLALPGADRLERIDYPNCSVASVRWDECNLEVASLGDCSTVIITTTGSGIVLHDATLDALDGKNYERMYRFAKENGLSMREARIALNDRFIEHRLLMNEPGGYWAADITCRGFGHEWLFKIPKDDVAGVVSWTDGFAAAVDMGVVPDALTLAREVLAGEGENLAERLRTAEREDADCWRVHRSKTSDDATYMVLRFS